MNACALIIGINDYPEETGQKPLAGAVEDAIDFALWAIDPNGGGVDPDNLYFWIHSSRALPQALTQYENPDRPWPREPKPNFAHSPTRRDVIRAADATAKAAAASGNDERLYVFLAGHGVLTTPLGYGSDPQSCFVAADFDPDDALGLVPLDDLRRAMERNGPKESVLLFDCCRNELPPTIPAPSLDLPVGTGDELNDQWMVGKAAQEKAIAFETTTVPTRGAFTKVLVQALRQYRVNNQLTADDLKGFVRNGVARLVEPKRQIPAITTRHDTEPFVVASGPPIGPLPQLQVNFPPDITGDVRLLDATDRQIGVAVPIQNARIAIPLEPGQYTIDHPASGRFKPIFHSGPEPTIADF